MTLPSTPLNSTQLNSTQLNSTQLNSTQLNSTQLNLPDVYGIFEAVSEIENMEKTVKAAAALQGNALFLNTLIESIPMPVFYKNTEGRYIGLNKAFEQLIGKPREELLGKNVFDIAPREQAEIYHAKDRELIENSGVQVYEAKMQGARGVTHDVVYHKATFNDTDGKVVGLIGVVLDITERKQAEEALVKAGALQSAIFNSANFSSIATDAKGVIKFLTSAPNGCSVTRPQK